MQLLEVQDLTIYFGGLPAVNGINLRLDEGTITGLIGPNGSGKTTFFNLVTGFLKPNAGRIAYKNEIISGLAPHQIARRGIVRTYQKTSIFSDSSVLENVIIGTHLWTKTGIWDALWKTPEDQKERVKSLNKAEEILEFMELAKWRNFLGKNLPYGEQRKLEIAIALACNPELLLLDEPAAGMTPEETFRLIGMIQKIKSKGITILLVDHDMKMVMRVCEEVIVLNYGEKIAVGTPNEICNNPEVIKVYLGEETFATRN